MHLEILTPEKKIFHGDVSLVSLPGTDGSFQIQNHHAPLVSLLKAGTLKYNTEQGETQINLSGGTVEVKKNTVTVLIDKIVE